MYGWSAYSEVVSIQAARIPLVVQDLSSSVVDSIGEYRLDWSLADDQGSELLEQTLEIWSESQATWITQPLLQPSANSYQVEMSFLEHLDYGYVQG